MRNCQELLIIVYTDFFFVCDCWKDHLLALIKLSLKQRIDPFGAAPSA
jgi:hypothetical protein